MKPEPITESEPVIDGIYMHAVRIRASETVTVIIVVVVGTSSS